MGNGKKAGLLGLIGLSIVAVAKKIHSVYSKSQHYEAYSACQHSPVCADTIEDDEIFVPAKH